jgi:hypothetical protein
VSHFIPESSVRDDNVGLVVDQTTCNRRFDPGIPHYQA